MCRGIKPQGWVEEAKQGLRLIEETDFVKISVVAAGGPWDVYVVEDKLSQNSSVTPLLSCFNLTPDGNVYLAY